VINTFRSGIDQKGEAGRLKNLPVKRGVPVLILDIENPDIEKGQVEKPTRAHLYVASNRCAGGREKNKAGPCFPV